MEDTILIQITNAKALKLLYDLEELNLIRVLKKNVKPKNSKISDKYKGVFTAEDADSFDKHTNDLRKEWDNI